MRLERRNQTKSVLHTQQPRNHFVELQTGIGKGTTARAVWPGKVGIGYEYILEVDLEPEEIEMLKKHNQHVGKPHAPEVPEGLSLSDFKRAQRQRLSGKGLPTLKEIRQKTKTPKKS